MSKTIDHQLLPPRALIGMIHLPALPGSPAAEHSLATILTLASADAQVLEQADLPL
jgi:predicted TIM-barrel enzyme